MIAVGAWPSLRGFAVAALAACAAIVLLSALARRIGWVDDGGDAPDRKHQRGGVPFVGGSALVVAALALLGVPGGAGLAEILPRDASWGWTFEPTWFCASLLLAFGTGIVDDARERGLGPAAKLAGQSLAAAALALALRVDAQPAVPLDRGLVFLLAVAAQNVANAFDHADGTLGSVAGAGLLAAGASLAGAVLAFLPFNLLRRRPGGPPLAYLGDSGSHFLGILLVTSALGWSALTLPALDLARVVIARARAGDPVWRGDRRHLGQRLEAAGRSPAAGVVIVLACASPAFAAVLLAPALDLTPSVALAAGAGGCAVLLGAALRLHPAFPVRGAPRAP